MFPIFFYRAQGLLSFLLIWGLAATQVSSQELASPPTTRARVESSPDLELEKMVLVELGELPIVISAPHGGRLKIPNVEPRQGEGLEKGPSGFFVGRDGGTEELAKDVIDAIQEKLGKRPYSVISSIDRKYLDPNRPADIAYENEMAKPVYDRYHNSLKEHCRAVLNEFHSGILLDIHGQGSKRDTVFRGTSNGKTVSRIREQFGEGAHTGGQSIFGLLKNQGWTVFPDPFDGREQSGFTGGYIVRTYGSHQATGIDAIQLEFGAEYRSPSNRKRVASELASALVEYSSLYLHLEPLLK